MGEGFHDEAVLRRVIEVLDESEVREHTTEAAHVLRDVQTELLLEDEEKGCKDLNDVAK